MSVFALYACVTEAIKHLLQLNIVTHISEAESASKYINRQAFQLMCPIKCGNNVNEDNIWIFPNFTPTRMSFEFKF